MTANIGHGHTPPRARDVLYFWEAAGSELWFAKDDGFDRRFGHAFRVDHEAARAGELGSWEATPGGALALTLVLDQFPRNVFRGTPRMYESGARAREVAGAAVARGDDRRVSDALALFFYLPFGRNAILGRASSAAERDYLANGGYQG